MLKRRDMWATDKYLLTKMGHLYMQHTTQYLPQDAGHIWQICESIPSQYLLRFAEVSLLRFDS